MSNLISLDKFPPGGFVFRQPETGWTSDFGLTFRQTCEAVQKHRLANPRFKLETDLDAIALEVEAQVCARISVLPGASHYCTATAPFPQARLQAGQRRQVQGFRGVAVIDRARNAVAGVDALLDWLGNGARPVEQSQAEARAAVCVACPMNVKGDLAQRLEAKAADMLRKQIEIRKELKLRTAVDEALNVCNGCDCWLQLKVHVPFQNIANRTRTGVWNRLHGACWMLKERGQSKEYVTQPFESGEPVGKKFHVEQIAP